MHDFDLYETCVGLWGLTDSGTKYERCVARTSWWLCLTLL